MKFEMKNILPKDKTEVVSLLLYVCMIFGLGEVTDNTPMGVLQFILLVGVFVAHGLFAYKRGLDNGYKYADLVIEESKKFVERIKKIVDDSPKKGGE